MNKKRSLQFADGHVQVESCRLLAFAKCHIEDSMVGVCNHAVSFPKCGLELFP